MLKNIKILILTAPFGNGHKMAAKSLSETFKQEGCNVIVCDLFTASHPVLTSNISKTHNRLFNLGSTYSYLYYGIDKISSTKLINVYRMFGYSTLKKIIKDYQPHIIINTFPVLSAPEFMRKYQWGVPVINVVTDYCCHRLWVNEDFDRIYLATDDLKEKLIKMHIPVNKLEVTGIPIRPGFEEDIDLEEVSKKYQVDISKRSILISAGAAGVSKDLDYVCTKLNKIEGIQILLVCGNNLKLRRKIDNLGLNNVKTFGYIDEIHELYRLATIMITKPGGITLSEAAAAKLPLILYKPIPGQEKENADYFVHKGAALIARTSTEAYEHVVHVLSDEEILNQMKRSLSNFYRSSSSKNIVQDLLSRYTM
jgi:processive 1,2-diacylglycerol beta-glucosyltransferase